jgi:hypothetical protein
LIAINSIAKQNFLALIKCTYAEEAGGPKNSKKKIFFILFNENEQTPT